VAGSPYPGLRPFERDDADVFFGREAQIDAMVDRLARGRLLAVTGSSGSGKSSLVRAGLLEALETGLLAEAGPTWRFAILRPRDHPMSELAGAVLEARGLAREPADIALRRAALERGPLSLVDELSERPLLGGANLLLLVDQFEEVFRYQRQNLTAREEAEALVALLLASAAQRVAPIYVVLTMRSEFLGRCADFIGLAEAVSDSQFLCPRLTREAIVAAIERPAAVFGGSVEPALVSRIINDMGIDADQLPLMQQALMRLWKLSAPMLTLKTYLEQGGLKAKPEPKPGETTEEEGGEAEEAEEIKKEPILSRHAEEILATVSDRNPQAIETARRLFCLLIEGEGDNAVRRVATVEEVMAVSEQSFQRIAEIADAFRATDCNFLTPAPERPLVPGTVLDISHESLIRHWRRLNDWVRREAVSAAQYRELAHRAERWQQGNAELLDGVDLQVMLAWLARDHPNPDWAKRYAGDFAAALRFLQQSRARYEAVEAERREAERQRIAAEEEVLARAQAEAEIARQRRRFASRYVAIALLALTLIARVVAMPSLADRGTDLGFDLWQRTFPRPSGDPPVCVVHLDEASLRTIGSWPWPRSVDARLVDELREAGAAAVAWEFVFADPTVTEQTPTQGEAPQAGAQQIAAAESDRELVAATAKVPPVAGFALVTTIAGNGPVTSKAGFAFLAETGSDASRALDVFPAVVSDFPALLAASAGNGFVTKYHDVDGVVRRPLIIATVGPTQTLVPSLPLEVLRVAAGAKTYIVHATGPSFGQNALLNFLVAGITVPADGSGRIWLHYSRPTPERVISAGDVLVGKFDPAAIAGKIVLIGPSAEALQDLHPTPILRAMAGVDIDAQEIDQIMQGVFLDRPRWAASAEAVASGLFGIVIILLSARLRVPMLLGLFAGCVAAVIGSSAIVFVTLDLLIDWVVPVLGLCLAFILASLASLFGRRRSARRNARAATA
jgi:CHASE2 domain-containing sensor protein